MTDVSFTTTPTPFPGDNVRAFGIITGIAYTGVGHTVHDHSLEYIALLIPRSIYVRVASIMHPGCIRGVFKS